MFELLLGQLQESPTPCSFVLALGIGALDEFKALDPSLGGVVVVYVIPRRAVKVRRLEHTMPFEPSFLVSRVESGFVSNQPTRVVGEVGEPIIRSGLPEVPKS